MTMRGAYLILLLLIICHISEIATATAALPTASQWIIETPETKYYYQTATEIEIDGSGIDCGPAPGQGLDTCLDVQFSPVLTKNVDYMVTSGCCSASKLKLTLITGKKWRTSPGPLYLVKIRTGDAFTFDPPVLVANIVADPVVTAVTTAGPRGAKLFLDIANTGISTVTLNR